MARQMLKEAEISRVAGGVAIDNNWGDNKVYKCAIDADSEYTHTFSADRLEDVNNIACETYDPELDEHQNDVNIWNALLAEPGLLSPL